MKSHARCRPGGGGRRKRTTDAVRATCYRRRLDAWTASHSRQRRKSCALIATITVLADMSTEPIDGDRTNPYAARTPAASGIATMF
jgi:hypothetical protein